MIAELLVVAIVVVMPVTLGLGMVAAIGLVVAGFAIDPEQRRLVRPARLTRD